MNTICLFYGANPAERGNMAQLLRLPDDRATRCEEKFGLAYDSGGAVLDDWAENGGGFSIQMIAPASGESEAGQWVAEIPDAEITALNDEVTLPGTLNVTVGSCGKSNAFYDPTQGSIAMCTALVEDLLARFDATLAAGKPAGSPAPAPTGGSLGQADDVMKPTITIAPNAKGKGAGNDFQPHNSSPVYSASPASTGAAPGIIIQTFQPKSPPQRQVRVRFQIVNRHRSLIAKFLGMACPLRPSILSH